MSAVIPDEISVILKNFWFKNWHIILIITSCIVIGYASVTLWGPDNPIEQDVEKVIEAQTGISVDLTP